LTSGSLLPPFDDTFLEKKKKKTEQEKKKELSDQDPSGTTEH